LEAISRVTSRGADMEAFREVMSIHAAHDGSLWKECTKFRWARLRMNLYCWKQRAFASFFNQLSALTEDRSQRLVVAYGAGRWMTRKGCTPAPTTRTYKECAHRYVKTPLDEFRTSSTHHELCCTLQRVAMEKSQRLADGNANGKEGDLRGLLALVRKTNDGKKRIEFVN